ncbi:MAG: hypothetical protein FJ311_09335 [Rhodospirillales bacterium]|nr:hypothetical protein [Rhodospirillales bacterium]
MTTIEARTRSALAAAILGAALLTGCETQMPAQKLPDLTFAHLPPLALAVQRVEIDLRFAPTLRAPNVEHTFPVPPARALERWASQRLKPVGGSAPARFVILDASVTETKLPRDTSMRGYFTKQQSERYDAKVEAAIEINDVNRRAAANAIASRWTTVPEDASLQERERIKFDLIEGLMKDFDAEIEKNVRQHLANWVR